MKTILKSNQGVALVIVIMTMVLLLSITGASLLLSGLNLKTASNLRTGGGAIHAADAGLQHALAVIPDGGNFTYSTGGDPVLDTTVFPDASSGYSYLVTATNNPDGTPNTSTAILTATGTGPNGSTRVIKAYVGRSTGGFVTPGAIYLPGTPANIETVFNGNTFAISGNDTNPGEAVGSGPESPVPGLASTDSGTTTEITDPSTGTLASTQYDQVTGQGSDPSVATSSTTIDVDQLAIDLIALGVEETDKETLDPGTFAGITWGTETDLQITHVTGDASLVGTSTGWGVLIVDGDLNTMGNFTYNGLVIVRGDTDIHGAGGASEYATIYGALFAKESTATDANEELKIGGNGKIYYSSQTMNSVLSNWGSAFPSPARVIAWHEVMQ